MSKTKPYMDLGHENENTAFKAKTWAEVYDGCDNLGKQSMVAKALGLSYGSFKMQCDSGKLDWKKEGDRLCKEKS